MSIWVSVYCKKSVGTINPTRLVAEIRERAGTFSYLFAREDPEDALARLRVEEYHRPSDTPLLHLHYLKEGPPVVIESVTELAQVAGQVKEYLTENFRGRKGKQAALVRKHLGGVVELIHFCLKQSHVDGMGTPLVYAASAWLAEVGDGLVRVDDEGWLRLTGSGDFAIITSE